MRTIPSTTCCIALADRQRSLKTPTLLSASSAGVSLLVRSEHRPCIEKEARSFRTYIARSGRPRFEALARECPVRHPFRFPIGLPVYAFLFRSFRPLFPLLFHRPSALANRRRPGLVTPRHRANCALLIFAARRSHTKPDADIREWQRDRRRGVTGER